MRCVRHVSLVLVFAGSAASAADISGHAVIDFPCSRNTADQRVLVEAARWDERMRELGYVLEDGAYVPYEVVSFTQQKHEDDTWETGICRLKLLPVAR